MTQEEHLTTFLALPSRSILHRPAHSPSFMLLSTLIRGMPCSMQRAVMSFLYIGSSQFSARMQSRACLLSRALAASLTPPARPSAIRACLRTSWMAVLISMDPATGAADGTSSPSYTWMVTVFWLSAAVEKIWLFLVGMTVFLGTSLVMTPPTVSIPRVRGLTSRRTISPVSCSPERTPAWTAAP